MTIFNLPQNSLSFGNVSFGILNSLYQKNVGDYLIKDIGNPDLSSFDKRREDESFLSYVNEKRFKFLERFSRESTQFSLWHINGSETSVSNKNVLFTFHECDSLTETEKNILNQQDHIIVSCDYSKNVFEECGVTKPISVIPLGFDNLHFVKTNKRKTPEGVCSFTIMGKTEHRKHTIKTAKLLIKKFGNNPKVLINLSVFNPFFSGEDNNRILASIFDNKPKPYNVNILPYVQTVSEVNDVLNFTDVLVDMSGAESFSLPSFNATCLGKHSIVHYNTGIKQWATEETSTLVNSSKKIPLVDGVFFKEGGDFNQGNFYDYDDEEFLDKLDVVYKKWQINKINEKGLELAEKFSWDKSTDSILEILNKI
jgi:glycosyltransferase involved in cell wall biosynthesis